VLADNQAAVAKGLERAGVGIDIGVPDSAMEQRLLTELDRISADPVTRRHMSESGQELIDGQGADRVLATMSPPLELRPATRDDAELLLRWANDRGVRKASFDPRPIDWDEHVAWLEARLRDPFSRIWVALDGKTPSGRRTIRTGGRPRNDLCHRHAGAAREAGWDQPDRHQRRAHC